MSRGLEGVARCRVLLGGGRDERGCGAVVICRGPPLTGGHGRRGRAAASTRLLLGYSINGGGCCLHERVWRRAVTSRPRVEGCVLPSALLALENAFEL
jgi:hypothetical protein